MSLSLPRFLLPAWRPGKRFEAYRNDDRIGLCVNLERPFKDKKILSASDLTGIIGSLNLSRIAVRIPLHDIDRLVEYVSFIRELSKYEVLVVVLQDREHIEDKAKLVRSLRRIFAALAGTVGRFQIGNAVNRLKWGFLTQREYLEFFETAWNLRNREFPSLKLLGGAVIDFELHEHCGSLFNPFPFRYDGYASLLYVDRRGAPENRQFGFDLLGKVEVLRRLAASSDKLPPGKAPPLWITEVNWPRCSTPGGTRHLSMTPGWGSPNSSSSSCATFCSCWRAERSRRVSGISSWPRAMASSTTVAVRCDGARRSTVSRRFAVSSTARRSRASTARPSLATTG